MADILQESVTLRRWLTFLEKCKTHSTLEVCLKFRGQLSELNSAAKFRNLLTQSAENIRGYLESTLNTYRLYFQFNTWGIQLYSLYSLQWVSLWEHNTALKMCPLNYIYISFNMKFMRFQFWFLNGCKLEHRVFTFLHFQPTYIKFEFKCHCTCLFHRSYTIYIFICF